MYADLNTFKDWIGVGQATHDRDSLLNLALLAASRQIDVWTNSGGFDLDTTPTARLYDPVYDTDASTDRAYLARYGTLNPQFGRSGSLIVDPFSTLTGLKVEQGDGGTWTDVTANIEAQPIDAGSLGEPYRAVYSPDGWTIGPYARVRVTARWGWPAVPSQIQLATLMYASKLYERRNSANGVLGPGEWGPIRVGRVDPDVAALIGVGFTTYTVA